jgi:hypothetical protein
MQTYKSGDLVLVIKSPDAPTRTTELAGSLALVLGPVWGSSKNLYEILINDVKYVIHALDLKHVK